MDILTEQLTAREEIRAKIEFSNSLIGYLIEE